MNILFIFPLNEPYLDIVHAGETAWKSKLNVYKNIKKLDCAYPTGLLSISAYLKKNIPEANIKILDFNAVMNQVAKRKKEKKESFEGYNLQDLLREGLSSLKGFDPDIIGISTLFCSNYLDLKPLAAFLKKECDKSLIVCGGHLASAIYERIFKDDIEIDAVGFGEGEVPLLELARAVLAKDQKRYLALSPSWVTKEKCSDGRTFIPRNNVIVNLDEIPPFDLGMLVDPGAYFNSTKYFFVIETMQDKKEMFIFSTRGCPYGCIFCASQNVHGNQVRYYSVERIKKDIDYYKEEYNVSRFVFYDDHFLINKSRAIEIMDYITSKGLMAEIPTPAFFSIDKDIAAAMKRSGIREVNITIESGNENTLKDIMHKPGTLKKANEAVEFLHEQGIVTVSNILIGLPGETKESIDKGLEYLLTTNINWFQCFVTAPLPGSELYKICKEKGYLINEGDLSYIDYKKCFIKTQDFTPEYIERKAYEMNLTLNFVNNYDYRMGNYETALKLFERVINAVIDTHAFAYYFAAKCCLKLHLDAKYRLYKDKYEEMIQKYEFWKEYAAQFNLAKLEDKVAV